MKKILLIGLAVAMVMVPMALPAQVEPVGGSMSIGAHIDFVGRYSAEDQDDPDPEEVYWAGYETFNMEGAIIYVTGQVGDNISYAIGEALAMPMYAGGVTTPMGTATLLDAKLTWSITDSIKMNMGRYIPHTSMSMAPHMLKVHHLVNPPMMITGGGYVESSLLTGGVVLIPLPRYQTGIGVEAAVGPAIITWDLFNGSELVGAQDNLTEMDKCKGGVIKAAFDSGAFHGGLYYLNERSDLSAVGGVLTLAGITVTGVDDNDVTQMGIELSYMSDRFGVIIEYLDTNVDLMDTDVPDLHQNAYYVLGSVGLGPVDIVLRYDYAEAGIDEFIDDIDGMDADEDDVFDNQTDYTLGVNYGLNDFTTVALNYAMRQPEVPDVEIGGDDISYPNIDEISIMVEMDLL